MRVLRATCREGGGMLRMRPAVARVGGNGLGMGRGLSDAR